MTPRTPSSPILIIITPHRTRYHYVISEKFPLFCKLDILKANQLLLIKPEKFIVTTMSENNQEII